MTEASQPTVIPEELLKKANPLLDKAKLQLMSIKKSTFTTSILFGLKFKWSLDIPTMDVTIEELRINPNFFIDRTPPERVFLLAHEAWHVAFDHINRFRELPEYNDDPSKNKADFKVYNEAADHVINNMLKAKGYQMPPMGCCNPKYATWSTEQVYYDLMKNKSSDPNFVPDFTPLQGKNGKSPSQQELQKAKSKVDEALVKANIASEMQAGQEGAEDVPDIIKQRIEDIIDPKIYWADLLLNYMFETSKEDYSFKRPNRRYMPDIIVPSLYSEALGKISVGIDVSGSIGKKEFNVFRAEAQEIIESMNPSHTEIVQWHHGIADVAELDPSDDINDVEFKESGGTNVTPLLKHWIRNPPEIAIIFTDGYFRPFEQPENITFPVIWVIYDNDNFQADFGRVVPYEIDYEKVN